MEQTTHTPPALTYEQIKENPDFPQSRWALIKMLFKSQWQQFKSGFPKNLLKILLWRILPMLLFAGLFYVINIYVICFMNDTLWINNANGNLARKGFPVSGSWIAYLFNAGIRGSV